MSKRTGKGYMRAMRIKNAVACQCDFRISHPNAEKDLEELSRIRQTLEVQTPPVTFAIGDGSIEPDRVLYRRVTTL